MDLSPLVEFCREAGSPLTSDQEAAFMAYGEALYARNAETNLTRVPQAECALRHFVDSLLVARFCPQGARVLDLGTGPGLPAWPLAVWRADLSVTAVDSNRKMLSFLREHPLPNLEVVEARAEQFERREEFGVVTGRAVAPLGVQLELSAPFCKIRGLVVPFRTPAEEEAVVSFPALQLGLRLVDVMSLALPGTEVLRLFPVFEKVKPTEPEFPRPWARIKARPLGPPTSRRAQEGA
jgi:16S rRNA (guanine527-N7)-methyltransferase